MKQSDEIPSLDIRLRMAKEIALSIAHIHSHGVQHRDLSVRNLFLFDELHVKLGDFGASALEGYDFPTTFCEGTQYELPNRGRGFHDRPMKKRDLFALGSAIYEITSWQRRGRVLRIMKLSGDLRIISVQIYRGIWLEVLFGGVGLKGLRVRMRCWRHWMWLFLRRGC